MEVTKFIKLALKILQFPSVMQLTWKAIPCKVIVFPSWVLKFMELMFLEELRIGKSPSLMGRNEGLVLAYETEERWGSAEYK